MHVCLPIFNSPTDFYTSMTLINHFYHTGNAIAKRAQKIASVETERHNYET